MGGDVTCAAFCPAVAACLWRTNPNPAWVAFTLISPFPYNHEQTLKEEVAQLTARAEAAEAGTNRRSVWLEACGWKRGGGGHLGARRCWVVPLRSK